VNPAKTVTLVCIELSESTPEWSRRCLSRARWASFVGATLHINRAAGALTEAHRRHFKSRQAFAVDFQRVYRHWPWQRRGYVDTFSRVVEV
jgi:hypothetical protein